MRRIVRMQIGESMRCAILDAAQIFSENDWILDNPGYAWYNTREFCDIVSI